MSSAPASRITPQDYLSLERQSETRHQYLDGEMFAMSGASRIHNLIVGNVSRELGSQFKERPIEVYSTDMRVRVDATGLYTYPDVVVVCGEPQPEAKHLDTLLNPTVLFEVVSESTAAFDRGRKFAHYRQIPSLREFVLVEQETARVEHHSARANNGS
jgi:Uma2 family endonuclease